MPHTARLFRRAAQGVVLAVAVVSLSGCAVALVAGTAAAVVTGTAGLAVDAAVGAVKLTGKAAGAAVDAVLPGDSED